MQDPATSRRSVKTVVRLLSGAAALMILAVPATAARVFAPRFVPAEAPHISLAVDDNLAAYGVHPTVAPAVPADPVPARPAEAPSVVLLQNWQYTRGKPSINPPK